MEENVTQLPMADMPESDYGKSINLSRKELLGLWGMGVIGVNAYVYLALKFDGFISTEQPFNMGAFCSRWTAGEMSTGTEREKPLKPKHVLTALAFFGDKEIAAMPNLGSQLQMHGV